MTIDTSAVIAILNDEPSCSELEELIAASDCAMSSVSYLEASIVLLQRRGGESLASLDLWLETTGIEVVPFTATHARLARNAYAHFGKGRHPAGLNFGDCATYGLVMERGDDLLYKGDDFKLTDVPSATVN